MINEKNSHTAPSPLVRSRQVQQEYEMMDQDMYLQGERLEKGDIPLTKY